MKKRFLALLLVLSLMFTMVLAGCSNTKETSEDQSDKISGESAGESSNDSADDPVDEPDEEDSEAVLNWNIGSDPKTIDPTLNGASDGGDVINQTFEGLVREKSGKVYPGIAKSWEVSEDGLTLTFHLRDSKWSDGSDLTAHDFVYSWKRGMNPATASEYSWIWKYTNVAGAYEAVNGGSLDDVGVTALDNHTLEVKLNAPTDYLVSLLAFYHFMPVKESAVVEGEDGAWAKDADKVVSNGPFKLVDYRIGDGLTLVKNENYWNADNVGIDKIEGAFIDSESTAFQAFQSGELDYIPNVPVAEIPKLIAENPNFYVFPLLGTYYYNFNLNLEMFQEPKVRKALALAIDREEIVETLGAGQVPATGFIPPGFVDADGKDFFETAGTYGFKPEGNIELAQQLLEEAGYPNGEGFPEFTIMYNTSENHQKVAELIQEYWKVNLGIETKLENQEWAVFQDTRKAGDFELARGGWLTDFMDPMGMLGIFVPENAYNDPDYDNPEFTELINKASKSQGKEHFEYLYEAQEIFMNAPPIVPVYHYSDFMLVSPKVQGWDRSVLGSVDFSGASIEE